MDATKDASDVAKKTVDDVSSDAASMIDQMRDKAKSVAEATSDRLSAATDSAQEAWSNTKEQVSRSARDLQGDVLNYTRDQPVKALLIAAAAGAALMALASALARSDD